MGRDETGNGQTIVSKNTVEGVKQRLVPFGANKGFPLPIGFLGSARLAAGSRLQVQSHMPVPYTVMNPVVSRG